MKVGQIITISDYTFERISEKEYNVTTPNGSTQRKYYLFAENLMKQLKNKQNDGGKSKSEVYSPGQPEYHKLRAFAEALNAFQDKLVFDVQICAKDFGAGISWTTIMAQQRKGGMSYMFFNPAQQKEVLSASYTDFSKLISTTLSNIKKGKYYDR